jgi:hypothetical protein
MKRYKCLPHSRTMLKKEHCRWCENIADACKINIKDTKIIHFTLGNRREALVSLRTSSLGDGVSAREALLRRSFLDLCGGVV